jgi:hypothetical protein
LGVELSRSVHRVDGGDHIAEAKMMPQHRIGAHRRQDRERVGKGCAFDNQAPEGRQPTPDRFRVANANPCWPVAFAIRNY